MLVTHRVSSKAAREKTNLVVRCGLDGIFAGRTNLQFSSQKGIDIPLTEPLACTANQNTSMLHIIWYIIVGFIVGWIARAIMPGAQHLGFIMTTLLGIAGSIVGGLIGRLFSKPEPGSAFHPAGFIMSIIGAIILLFIWIKLVA